MRQFLFAFMLLSFSKFSLAQSIVAGQHQQWDRYYDFVPDTSMVHCTTCGSFDLNGDGIDDISFGHIWGITTNWGEEMTYWVNPSSNTQISFLTTDTCYRYDSLTQIAYINGFAKTFNYNNVIDGANTWVDTSLYILKNKSEVVQFYHCYHSTVRDTFTYIGVRVFVPDTLYGWIKLKFVPGCPGYCSDTLRVESFACQTSLTGIQDMGKQELITVYPNPSDGIFHCTKRFSSGMLEVKDVNGRIVLSRELKNEQPTFDLSGYSEGVYFLSIISDEKKYEQRLVICK